MTVDARQLFIWKAETFGFILNKRSGRCSAHPEKEVPPGSGFAKKKHRDEGGGWEVYCWSCTEDIVNPGP